MSKLSARLKRITKALEEKRLADGQLKIIFQNCDESREQTLKRSGIQPDDSDMVVFITKFSRGESDYLVHRQSATKEFK